MTIYIIGGGPTGITLFKKLQEKQENVVLFEASSVLGGAHAVYRLNGLFSEHGPRVYSTNYYNTFRLFPELKKIMTSYNFQISYIGGYSFSKLLWNEKLKFIIAYFKSIISTPTESVLEFSKNMSTCTKDYLDRLTRFTDGASSDRYPLSEFLGLANSQALYTLLQPTIALDNFWEKQLKENMILNAKLKSVEIKNDNISKLIFDNKNLNVDINKDDSVLFAVPPMYLKNINILNNYLDLEWIEKTKYIDYISITFQWKYNPNLPKIYGFPKSEWKIAFINLGEYLKDEKMWILSTAITDTSLVPKNISESEIIFQVAKQLQLPNYDNAIVYHGPKNGWVGNEYKTPENVITGLKNVKSVGCHNGFSSYPFTSFECAVQNALHFTKNGIIKAFTLNDLILILIMIFVIIIFLFSKIKENV
jgi:hypothetical protein